MPTGKSVLIIDDEANLRSTLGIILQRGGYAVRGAANAQEALQILSGSKFDLIFLDLKMPGMDGMQLLPIIRSQHVETPVLVLTANASLDTAIEALRMGARGYLLKPIDPSQILSRVYEVLQDAQKEKLRREIVHEIDNLLGGLQPQED
jgi:DNA-binding NtrC family response regulator